MPDTEVTEEVVEDQSSDPLAPENQPQIGVSSDLAQFNESIGYPIENSGSAAVASADEVEPADDDDEAEVPEEPSPAAYTTGSKSVSAVQADVEAGTVSAADALAAEQSLSSPRPTLVEWLSNYGTN